VSFAVLFLSDGETYSGLDGHISVYDNKYAKNDNLEIIEEHKDISISALLRELKNKNELLPLEIQKLIEPIMDGYLDLDN